MTRALRLSMMALVAALVVGSAVVAGVAPAAASSADQFITMTSSTTPAQPTTDGEFTFTMTFRSAAESGDSIGVDSIEIRDGDGPNAEVLASRGYFDGTPPTLEPDGKLDQSFSLSFDESGVHELYVVATFDTGVERVKTTYRTNVTVYQPNPGIQIDAEPTTAGERTTVSVDVANGRQGSIRGVELSLDAESVDFQDQSRVASSVAGSGTTTFEFTGTPSELGVHSVETTLVYTTADGTRRRVTRTIDVRFRTPDFAGDMGIAADVKPAIPGGDTQMNLTLTNGLDVAIRQMEVRVSADDATIKQSRRVSTSFASGTERTFQFTASRSTTGQEPIEVAVSFTTADGVEGEITETLTTTFDAPTNPGEIRLTGVSASRQAGELQISATASNVGSSEVNSVIVSVGDEGPISAADYFVGNIEAGDFASFTLNTGVSGNVSSVPVTVTYVVDDVELSTTTEVGVEQSFASQPDGASSGGGGNGLLLLVGAVLLVVVAGAALVYRRRG